jgi:uncharacterized membrane protein
MTRKAKLNARQQRSLRIQQILGGVFAIIIILAMVLSLVSNV